MNMKQKLTYMLIGCLFTLAGYVLSSLFNTPPIQAQDEKTSVFDKIVCKKLEIVNDEGTTLAELDSRLHGGCLSLYKNNGNFGAQLGCLVLSLFGGGKSQALLGSSGLSLYTYRGKIRERFWGIVYHLYNKDGYIVTSISSDSRLLLFNQDGKPLFGEGKLLVDIGYEKGRPNDGLINIYNHKGEVRSFSTDGVSRME